MPGLRRPRPPSYREIILAENPLAYWRMDDGAPSGVSRNATGTTNSLSWGTTAFTNQFQGALSGDQNTSTLANTGAQKGVLNSPTPASVSAPFSLEFWVNLQSSPASGNGHQLFTSRQPSDNSFDLQVATAGLHGDVGSGSAWINTNIDITFTMNVGQWYHVVYVIDTANWYGYINGVQQATAALSGTGLLWDGTHTFQVMFDSLAGSTTVSAMDEIAVYGKALRAPQIQSHYLAATNPGYLMGIGYSALVTGIGLGNANPGQTWRRYYWPGLTHPFVGTPAAAAAAATNPRAIQTALQGVRRSTTY